MIAAYLLEVHDGDLEWDVDRFQVKGAPDRFKTMKEIAFAAYNKAMPRHRARPGGGELLRSAEHDLSVRRLYLRRSTSMSIPASPRSAASTRWTIAAPGSTR